MHSGPAIELIGVGKRFGAVTVVEGVSVTIERGEICVLIGPSGCGKTTTLKMINRVISHDTGVIKVRGRDIAGVDAVSLRRSIGYVIQHVGLFPHLSIADNIGLPLRLKGVDKPARRSRAAQLLELVGLSRAMLDRRPSQLSGGQQQRVGVARALAADPDIILMDEPFGAVDPLLRPQLQRELRAIQRQVQTTIVLVTHDLSEAFALGDRIVLMQAGTIAQQGTPREILLAPRTEFVRRFLLEARAADCLGLMRLADLPRADASTPTPEWTLPGETPLVDALSMLGAEAHRGRRHIGLLNEAGRHLGVIATETIVETVVLALRTEEAR